MVDGAPPAASAASDMDGLTETVEAARYSGTDRFATAISLSKQFFEPGVDAVFIVTGLDFPDAISASAPAASVGGPILLSSAGSVSPSTLAEVRRLAPKHVYVIGGTGVISSAVSRQLSAVAPTSRISGKDRYSTNRAIVEKFFADADQLFVATGRNFPDALAGSTVAGANGSPMLLVDGSKRSLSAETRELLGELDPSRIDIAGGTGAVTSAIESELNGVGTTERHRGADRYATAAAISAAYPVAGAGEEFFLAAGADYPDALAASAVSARTGIPLYLTQRGCMSLPTSDRVRESGGTQSFAVGGRSVVSAAAAHGARCVSPERSDDLSDWASTGWELDPTAAVPYSDRELVNVRAAAVDGSGLRIYQRRDNGLRAHHPVAYAQYGISALNEYHRTSEARWLQGALTHGSVLLSMRVEREGAYWFPYRFPWTYETRTLASPWYSAMAQGEVLSLFVRLYEATGDEKWSSAAERTWQSFLQPYAGASKPWAMLAIDGHLYAEEYAGSQPPLLVLNGQIFAAFGVWDYWKLTGDPQAGLVFDGLATTVRERMMPLVRVEGGVSYYCVQVSYCDTPRWQNLGYHTIHSWQLDTLARLTGDTDFGRWAALLRNDYTAPGTARMLPVEELAGEGGGILEEENDDEMLELAPSDAAALG